MPGAPCAASCAARASRTRASALPRRKRWPTGSRSLPNSSSTSASPCIGRSTARSPARRRHGAAGAGRRCSCRCCAASGSSPSPLPARGRAGTRTATAYLRPQLRADRVAAAAGAAAGYAGAAARFRPARQPASASAPATTTAVSPFHRAGERPRELLLVGVAYACQERAQRTRAPGTYRWTLSPPRRS